MKNTTQSPKKSSKPNNIIELEKINLAQLTANVKEIMSNRNSIGEQSAKEAIAKIELLEGSVEQKVTALACVLVEQDDEINELNKYLFKYKQLSR